MRNCLITNCVRVEGLEPPCLAAPDPKSGVSAISPHPLKGRQRYGNKKCKTANCKKNRLMSLTPITFF